MRPFAHITCTAMRAQGRTSLEDPQELHVFPQSELAQPQLVDHQSRNCEAQEVRPPLPIWYLFGHVLMPTFTLLHDPAAIAWRK